MILSFGLINPAIISAAASALNTIGNAFGITFSNSKNLKIARETNAANERMNQSQLDYNWDMWHAQNEYNNPSNARKRLSDAGLNPIYYGLDGSSAASGNSYSPIPAVSSSPNIPMNFDGISDLGMKLAQIENIRADTDKKKNESGLTSEQAETIRQLRSGQLVLQGQQIRLNIDQHELNGARRDEIIASVDSLRQSIFESDARISDFQSQISKREFDKKIQLAIYELDRKYKEGLLSYQEKQLAISWFEAYTNRQNASTNYYNAQTNRYSAYNDAFDKNQTRSYRNRFMNSISHFNDANARFVYGENLRRNKAFNLEQINRAGNAYKSVVDAFFSPMHHNSSLAKDALSFGF